MTRRLATLLMVLVACGGCAEGRDKRPAAADAGATEGLGGGLSAGQTDSDDLSQQVARNWLVDPGMDGLEGFIVVIDVEMNPDGSVRSAKIDRSMDNGNPNWPAFAESCRRAVLKSSPLRMPQDKPFEAWKRMSLKFTGRQMAGSP